MKTRILRADWLSRVLPFAVFIGFLILGQVVGHVLPDVDARWLYAVRAVCVAATLLLFWRRYQELEVPACADWRVVVGATAIGAAVFVAWINLRQPWITFGSSGEGFSPLRADGSVDVFLAVMRFAGAALVVPVMEELFWRSFLLRWIDHHEFLSLSPARVSNRALLMSSILFGFEHEQWFAGILAGLVYGTLYKRTGKLWAPVLAHAITNGMLGAWVLHTRNWQFW